MKKQYFLVMILMLAGCVSTNNESSSNLKSQLETMLEVATINDNNSIAEEMYSKSIKSGTYNDASSFNQFYNDIDYSNDFPKQCLNTTNFNNTYYNEEAACQCYLFEKTSIAERLSDAFSNNYVDSFRQVCATNLRMFKEVTRMNKLRTSYCNDDKLFGNQYSMLGYIGKKIFELEKSVTSSAYVDIKTFKNELHTRIEEVCNSSIDNALHLSFNMNSAPAVCFLSDNELLNGAYGDQDEILKIEKLALDRCQSLVLAKYKKELDSLDKNAIVKNQQYEKKKKEKNAVLVAKKKSEALRKKAQRTYNESLTEALLAGANSLILDQNNRAYASDINEIQNLIYMAVASLDKKINILTSKQFIASKQDEFEKSEEYNQRLSNDKKKFEQSKQEQLNSLRTDLENEIERFIGKWSVEQVKYDADTQKFSLIVQNVDGAKLTEATILIAQSEAQDIKRKLIKSKVYAIFSVDNLLSTISLNKIVLAYEDADPMQSIVFTPSIIKKQFNIDTKSSLAWQKHYSDKKNEQQKIIEQQLLEEKKQRAKTFPYIATLSCSYGRLAVCLGNDGSLEFRTGNKSQALSTYELAQNNEYTFELKHNFTIIAQNGSRKGRTLLLVINDLVTGDTLYSKSVSTPYGVIKITD